MGSAMWVDDFVGLPRRKLEWLFGQGYEVVGLALDKSGRSSPCWINAGGCVLWPRHEGEQWTHMNFPPHEPGMYLVTQAAPCGRRFRWVREWDGSAWLDAKVEKYGPVTYWMTLPALPFEERKAANV